MGKWIKFIEIEKKPKTKVYAVVTTYDESTTIGHIAWFSRWRKYAFYPKQDTVWEVQCLSDIINFINNLMLKRNQRLINEKAFPKKEK